MKREEFTWSSTHQTNIDEVMRCHLVATSTLVIAAVALAAVGAGVGAYSAVQQGKAAEESGKYNAAVERNNAILASHRAQFEADRLRKRNMLVRGQQRAAYAKSGVDISGSPEDVMFDTDLEGALDIQAARYAGRSAGMAHRARAELSLAEGRNARTASYYNAGATILGGAGSAASIASGYNRNRPLSTNDPSV